ncbi:hypothetical protein ACIQVN_02150 [Streptomyces cyaneofuscatus]|uniref:hypothetical protein n=1 Tax=Streptomyces cyaneofuscatus TaxID=66883 RepID=UPI0037F459C8
MQISTLSLWGACSFGVVIGWIAYRTLRRNPDAPRIADLLTIIAALGGGTVIGTQFGEPDLFAMYGIGLAVGFFAYLIVGSLVDRAARKTDERALALASVSPQSPSPSQPQSQETPGPASGGTVPQAAAGSRPVHWLGDK